VSGVSSGAQNDEFAEVETLIGGAGDDQFRLSQSESSNDSTEPVSYRLEGRGGNDAFRDGIWPSSSAYGFVTMLGGDGNDRFDDESDKRFTREVFFGEAGDDVVRLYQNGGTFDGGPGVDLMHFMDGGGDLRRFPGFENATATPRIDGGDDDIITLTGTDGPNVLSADGTRFQINGLGGNDVITGGSDDDTLQGGDGDDLLSSGDGDDELDGGAGNDAVDGGTGNNTILNAEIVPDAGRIRISNRILIADGSWGAELITIQRTGVDDVIVRVNNVARQFDMDEFDVVLLRGNNGYDNIEILDPLTSPVVRKVTLDGGAGNDQLFGNNGDDVLRGGGGADGLVGGHGSDALFGGAGNDRLNGGPGLDFLDGGDNDDSIDAPDSAGGDTVLGGSGSDTAKVDAGDSSSGIEAFV
jgi:Ca2+-binding RTX toxin-like protein